MLGGGHGWVAAAGASGQGMMIVPEVKDLVRDNFMDFLDRAVHYLDQNKRLVVTVAEKSYLPHDNTSSYASEDGKAVDSSLWHTIRGKQSDHGITEGNYLAEIMNRYFRRKRFFYHARDGNYDYMSRIAGGIDFDRWVARVYARKIADAIKARTTGEGVVGVALETPFDKLSDGADLFSLDKILEAPFPTGEGGYFDMKGWTVTQAYKDLICSFSRVRLPENGG